MSKSPWQSADEVPGWMSGSELAYLRSHASQCQSVVEIGSWKGRSTWALCESCPGVVHAVDWWGGSNDGNVHAFDELDVGVDVHKVFLANVGHFPNLVVHKMKSQQASNEIDGTIDMVFIDGDHSRESCLLDLLLWGQRTTRYLCGHDADWDGVVEALNEYAPGKWLRVCDTIWEIDVWGMRSRWGRSAV